MFLTDCYQFTSNILKSIKLLNATFECSMIAADVSGKNTGGKVLELKIRVWFSVFMRRRMGITADDTSTNLKRLLLPARYTYI